MKKCNFCPRQCEIDRSIQIGYCKANEEIIVSKAMLHNWEEPFISGENGSGAIFFSGCSLSCVYWQNHSISSEIKGYKLREENLAELMLKLQEFGAHNINLVTASHFVDKIVISIIEAKNRGLNIPIVYNSSGYETVETLKKLDGLIDIYLPDFKYFSKESAKRYSKAEDYPEIVKKALDEMLRQVGPLKFEDDLVKKGLIIRHLMLPNHLEESKDIIEYIYDRYKNDVFISIMNQYLPMFNAKDYPEINRAVTSKEYDSLVDFAISIGVENALVQDDNSQDGSYTPDFEKSEIIEGILNIKEK